MQTFQVVRVVDGDTFDVSPGWTWSGNSGNRIRPAGYDAAEVGAIGGAAATAKLSSLILGRSVQLGAAHTIDRGRLVCEVYFDGRNLTEYFRKRAPHY